MLIACDLAVGFAFSTMARRQMQAQQLTQFGLLPSIMPSGFIFPFRGVLLKGNGLPQIWPDLWPVIAFCPAGGDHCRQTAP